MRRAPLADRRVLDRAFYWRDPSEVARELLNKVLVRNDGRSGRIVEVEAYYGSNDAASHSFHGKSPRNATMFGPAGHLYVYFVYGMHWCCNAVCGEIDEGSAVLLRALEPLSGLAAMRLARPRCPNERDLCRGPARLCQAFGIDASFDGVDLVAGDGGLVIADDGMPFPAHPSVSARVGISTATDKPWRWYVAGSPYVSRT